LEEHRKRLISGEALSGEEDTFSWSLRPTHLAEFVGQRETVEKLNISVEAAQKRGEPLEHVLLYGPPGLGKTTVAHIIANEMDTRLVASAGPSIEKAADLMGILTSLEEGEVLFIDEIHRLRTPIEEFLYPAMEDFKVDFVVDRGAFAKTINVPLKPFTLVGATTRAGLLSSPMRNRFGLFYHMDFYPVEDLKEIVLRSSKLLDFQVDEEVAQVVAKRSRGTPRVANRLLKRFRDFAEVKAEGKATPEIARQALALEGIDELGLDALDRKFMRIIIEHYKGGPVGIETVAATLNEETDTLQDVVEPFLLKIGFLNRTRTGRMATEKAYVHLGLNPKKRGDLQEELF